MARQKEPKEEKRKAQSQSQHSSQLYDNTIKALLGEYAAEIIAELVPGAEVVDERPNEIKRENLRADSVQLIRYKGEWHVLHMELQSGPEKEMARRMLRYHVDLHIEYDLPVLSLVLYLFEASLPKTPYREMSKEEELLRFPYRVLALWLLDARDYIGRRVIFMYPLLPGMKNADAALLVEAINQMKQYYPQSHLVRHLRRFRVILRRSTMVSEQDKQIVEDQMQTYDQLIDEDPEVQERIARAEAEGGIKALREMMMTVVENKFPALRELAEERLTLMRNLGTLQQLVIFIVAAPDEATARFLLTAPMA